MCSKYGDSNYGKALIRGCRGLVRIKETFEVSEVK